MDFFRMYAEVCVEDYVEPGPELQKLAPACFNSEFQFLDHAPLSCSLADGGGVHFPDFLLYRSVVPLISERFRKILEAEGVDNLFYKPVILEDRDLALKEYYWLALPPRIDCLAREECEIEIEPINSLDETEWPRYAKTIVIDPARTGNYKIFKLPSGYENTDIIVTSGLRQAIITHNLENVYFHALTSNNGD